jgi:NADPH-dependent F420 reductase
MNSAPELPTIAVIGGTGKEGKGLAYRLSRAGYRVIIGSRSADKATQAARELQSLVARGTPPMGTSNLEAASMAAVILLTVPHEAHAGILESIKPAMAGKLLIDATVPLQPGKPTRVRMPAAGSAAQEAQLILGTDTEVAAAFHTISHEHLLDDAPIQCDVLVTGTSASARAQALEVVAAAGLQGWDAGPLENSSVSEGLTSILIHINKKYGSRHAGIRITGAGQA